MPRLGQGEVGGLASDDEGFGVAAFPVMSPIRGRTAEHQVTEIISKTVPDTTAVLMATSDHPFNRCQTTMVLSASPGVTAMKTIVSVLIALSVLVGVAAPANALDAKRFWDEHPTSGER